MTRQYLPSTVSAMESELDAAWRGDMTESGRALKEAGAEHRRVWARRIVTQVVERASRGEGETW